MSKGRDANKRKIDFLRDSNHGFENQNLPSYHVERTRRKQRLRSYADLRTRILQHMYCITQKARDADKNKRSSYADSNHGFENQNLTC